MKLFALAAALALMALPAPGAQCGVVRHLGIPYAAAPTGELRWRAPLAPGNRAALGAPPPRCPQSLAGLSSGAESEDCLYLNVYSPGENAPGKPVLVYIHGGGAVSGAASDHDGARLAQSGDMVVVTLNYRLGALGFMNSTALAQEGPSGNYAVLDVIAALRWVQARIGGFGGDPASVKIAGESAGGTILCPLLAMPQASGLFRAAIISSDDCLHDVDALDEARARAATLADALRCADAACLRQRSPSDIVRIGGKAGPNLEAGGLIPDYPYRAIARGDWQRLPLLIGANSEEGRIAGPDFVNYTAPDYERWLRKIAPENSARVIEKAYRAHGTSSDHPYAEKIAAIITDSGMRGFGGCMSLQLARAAARHAPVFYYQFEDTQAPMGSRKGFRLGAAHSAELPYLWPGPALTPDQQALSDTMIARWKAFVHGGSPWPALDARGKGSYMAFDQNSGLRSLRAYERQHKCAVWRRLPVIMDRGEP